MLYLVIQFLFVIVLGSQKSKFNIEPTCGRPNGIPATGRIVNGYDVGYYKYPWYAAITSDNEVICGGTLIGPRRILTAAHCFKPFFKQLIHGDIKLEDVYIYKLGIYNFCQNESSQREYRSVKVSIHEGYFEDMPFYDIAVIILGADTDQYTPICLPETITQSNTRPREGFAQGLGRLGHENETIPCTLQEARLLIYPDLKCMEVINSTENNGNALIHAFCAGYLDGKIDTCLGDSGGPFLVMGRNGHYVLQGITSFGFGCAQKDLLGIYTDVSHFLKWINEQFEIHNPTISPAKEINIGITKDVGSSTTNFNKEIAKPTISTAECGVPYTSNALNRIVGGQTAAPHIFPWLVYIARRGQLHCGGALINNKYVLTAGHCVKWYNRSEFTVVLGRHDRITETGIVIGAKDMKVHEDFTSDKLHDTNDIALIKMARAVKFTPFISPVCLPNPLSEYTNRIAIVAGWGRISQSGRPTRYVRKATVKIMPEKFCLESPIGPHYADSMICAYSNNIDACQGDSGGPLLYQRRPRKIELIGIVSWGIGCAQPNIPGAYTKLVNFLKWIEDNTLDGVYCSRN